MEEREKEKGGGIQLFFFFFLVTAIYVVLVVHVICYFREFARTIPRPFSVRYNPYTQSIDVINDKSSVANLVRDIKYEVDILEDALTKMD